MSSNNTPNDRLEGKRAQGESEKQQFCDEILNLVVFAKSAVKKIMAVLVSSLSNFFTKEYYGGSGRSPVQSFLFLTRCLSAIF